MHALCDANSFYASCEQAFRPDLMGKPVVVLSNNDGCVIARSKESKTLKIDMGAPFFKIRDELRRHDVAVFSSNYTLYDDMSRRVQSILRGLADRMEVYSIDESFMWWRFDLPWDEVGHQLKAKILKWTGLPVGIGFGPTKTLAKLANHLAKRGKNCNGVHVLDSPDAITAALEACELGDIWGVSTGTICSLYKLHICSPLEFRDADPIRIKDLLGIVGMRTLLELKGEQCIEMEDAPPNKQNTCVSRSFGKVTDRFEDVREAVATFASQAAFKMRRQNLVCGKVGVFVQTDRHAAVEQYEASYDIRLSAQTNNSSVLAKAAVWCLSKVFRKPHSYKKAGVMLFDLVEHGGAQLGLYGPQDTDKSDRLMQNLDCINKKFGRGTLRLASAAPFALDPCRTWHLRSEHRSPRYTTRWAEIPTARACNVVSSQTRLVG